MLLHLVKKDNQMKYEMVLARRDKYGEYGPENCLWRVARTETERKWGIEDCSMQLGEPEEIPLTPQQQKERSKQRTPSGKMMFDIWARMLWRADNS